jgi:hypothetical protein
MASKHLLYWKKREVGLENDLQTNEPGGKSRKGARAVVGK